ncbi:MAG: RNA polymerase sigma factor [Bdellovibrionales bacterium]|nr:RNA polymerase sigma factor [Bdellovibrionales bacterium]
MAETKETPELTDLVVRVQNGDERACGELIEATQASLYKFCLLLSRNREIAEDLCQETFIKALESISKLQNPATFVGWLYQIAKNLYIDLTRSAAFRKNVSEEEMPEAASGSDLEAVVIVHKVLADFDPEERFLLLLIELGGCSYKEAGEHAGMSEDAVRSKLHRLRQLFMQKYSSNKKS